MENPSNNFERPGNKTESIDQQACAIHFLKVATDIQYIQSLLGHFDLKTVLESSGGAKNQLSKTPNPAE